MSKISKFFKFIFAPYLEMNFTLSVDEVEIYETFTKNHFDKCGSGSPIVKFKYIGNKLTKELECPICNEIHKFQ